MNASIRATLLLCLSCAAAGVFAQNCDQAVTQADMNACMAKELDQADAELNKTYVALRAKLRPAQQNQIRDVQLAWIRYRDLACRFESANATGGSAAGMALTMCLADKTRQRTKELKGQSECGEGDISCSR